ncbi:hypothetical protein [Lysinibacillus sp. NPDC059133]|uniref:hypothetical protein n=1 Tax=Lysinibacillus sp. NPDC059133 TaxID=3346737 RepID=UPI003695B571
MGFLSSPTRYLSPSIGILWQLMPDKKGPIAIYYYDHLICFNDMLKLKKWLVYFQKNESMIRTTIIP